LLQIMSQLCPGRPGFAWADAAKASVTSPRITRWAVVYPHWAVPLPWWAFLWPCPPAWSPSRRPRTRKGGACGLRHCRSADHRQGNTGHSPSTGAQGGRGSRGIFWPSRCHLLVLVGVDASHKACKQSMPKRRAKSLREIKRAALTRCAGAVAQGTDGKYLIAISACYISVRS
jgi:hypothetical protein